MDSDHTEQSLLVPLGERVALFLSDGDDVPAPGRVITEVDSRLVGKVAKTASGLEGLDLPGTLTGRLVELDPQSVSMPDADFIREADGWFQGILRDSESKFARVARFRQIPKMAAIGQVAGMVSSVAQQSQLAAIRDEIAEVKAEVDYLVDWEHALYFGSAAGQIQEVNRVVHAIVTGGASQDLHTQLLQLTPKLAEVTETAGQLLGRYVDTVAEASRRRPHAAAQLLRQVHMEVLPALMGIDAAAEAAHARGDAVTFQHMLVNGEDRAFEAYQEQVRQRIRAWLDTRQDMHRQLREAAETIEGKVPSRLSAWARGGFYEARRRRQTADTITAASATVADAIDRTDTTRENLALFLALGDPASPELEEPSDLPPTDTTAPDPTPQRS